VVERIEVAVPRSDDAAGSAASLLADFAEWVSPHLVVLAAVAAVQVGAADADDVVQEALVRAWRRRATFDDARGSTRTWLLSILLDQARRYRVRRRPWQLADDTTVQPDYSSSGAAAADRLDVDRAVRSLPRRQRQVVTLHYLADLTVVEVAEVLGISVGSVKSCLFDARARLKMILEVS
jgi:RNA polymerase sigma-70 factor (ECF subfamily)